MVATSSAIYITCFINVWVEYTKKKPFLSSNSAREFCHAVYSKRTKFVSWPFVMMFYDLTWFWLPYGNGTKLLNGEKRAHVPLYGLPRDRDI